MGVAVFLRSGPQFSSASELAKAMSDQVAPCTDFKQSDSDPARGQCRVANQPVVIHTYADDRDQELQWRLQSAMAKDAGYGSGFTMVYGDGWQVTSLNKDYLLEVAAALGGTFRTAPN